MRLIVILLAAVLWLSMPYSAAAQGGAIVLSTTLLEVEPRQRTATISVANRTVESQRYRISVTDMVMGADGQVTAPEEGDVPRSASSWVIATPRSLTLEPGESQTLRLLFRRPANLADGEYRAHLKVAQEPPADIAGGLADSAEGSGMQINIFTVYTTSIPIVFRQGQLDVSAAMASAQLVDAERLSLTVERRGNASFRGFARATRGDAAPIDLPVTIYPEVDAVTRSYPLGALADTSGPLTVTLHEGLVPRPAEVVTSAALDTLTIAR